LRSAELGAEAVALIAGAEDVVGGAFAEGLGVVEAARERAVTRETNASVRESLTLDSRLGCTSTRNERNERNERGDGEREVAHAGHAGHAGWLTRPGAKASERSR
jgi:hypothetical protein